MTIPAIVPQYQPHLAPAAIAAFVHCTGCHCSNPALPVHSFCTAAAYAALLRSTLCLYSTPTSWYIYLLYGVAWDQSVTGWVTGALDKNRACSCVLGRIVLY